jgi:hypothetical protein
MVHVLWDYRNRGMQRRVSGRYSGSRSNSLVELANLFSHNMIRQMRRNRAPSAEGR